MRNHVFDKKRDAELPDRCSACGATWTPWHGRGKPWGWSVDDCPGEPVKVNKARRLTIAQDVALRERALSESVAKGYLRRNHGEGAAQQRAIDALRAHLPRVRS